MIFSFCSYPYQMDWGEWIGEIFFSAFWQKGKAGLKVIDKIAAFHPTPNKSCIIQCKVEMERHSRWATLDTNQQIAVWLLQLLLKQNQRMLSITIALLLCLTYCLPFRDDQPTIKPWKPACCSGMSAGQKVTNGGGACKVAEELW